MKTVLSALLVLLPGLLLAAPHLPAPQSGAGDEGDLTDAQEPGAHAMPERQKITTFLWYDDDAEEAIRFYSSIFEDAQVLEETRWGEGGPVPKGTLMSARFRLAGQEFIALNGGPLFRFTEAISLFVDCADQQEVDELWEKLSAGGEPGQCGWLKDRYGLSWQVIPTALPKLLGDKDPAKARRVTEAMLQMGKIDIRRLQQAYDGR